MTNKELIERYPFLKPHCDDYDYSWTELDFMPDGWRKAFGEMMCEELREELVKYDFLDEYSIAEIKEKWGGLKWYDNGYPPESRIGDIIGKYETLSKNICIHCGKPDVAMTGNGWILPLCEDCYNGDYSEWDNRSHKMSDVYRYRQYKDGEWHDVEVDISETAQKIRDVYNNKHKGEKG